MLLNQPTLEDEEERQVQATKLNSDPNLMLPAFPLKINVGYREHAEAWDIAALGCRASVQHPCSEVPVLLADKNDAVPL